MENPDFHHSITPLSVKNENVRPSSPEFEERTESREELLRRIQILKQDLQSWRMNLDAQAKVYRDELSELKSVLDTEVEQLRSEFKEIRTTLQQQQEDVTTSLRNLGLQEDSGDINEAEGLKYVENINVIAQYIPQVDNGKASYE